MTGLPFSGLRLLEVDQLLLIELEAERDQLLLVHRAACQPDQRREPVHRASQATRRVSLSSPGSKASSSAVWTILFPSLTDRPKSSAPGACRSARRRRWRCPGRRPRPRWSWPGTPATRRTNRAEGAAAARPALPSCLASLASPPWPRGRLGRLLGVRRRVGRALLARLVVDDDHVILRRDQGHQPAQVALLLAHPLQLSFPSESCRSSSSLGTLRGERHLDRAQLLVDLLALFSSSCILASSAGPR